MNDVSGPARPSLLRRIVVFPAVLIIIEFGLVALVASLASLMLKRVVLVLVLANVSRRIHNCNTYYIFNDKVALVLAYKHISNNEVLYILIPI